MDLSDLICDLRKAADDWDVAEPGSAQQHAAAVRVVTYAQSLLSLLEPLERRVAMLEQEARRGPDPRLWAGDAHDGYRR
jgi:hypothetical protein